MKNFQIFGWITLVAIAVVVSGCLPFQRQSPSTKVMDQMSPRAWENPFLVEINKLIYSEMKRTSHWPASEKGVVPSDGVRVQVGSQLIRVAQSEISFSLMKEDGDGRAIYRVKCRTLDTDYVVQKL